MAITLTTPAAPDGSWLTLRPPAPSDVEALQAMLDDPVIRTAMGWPDRDRRNAADWIEEVRRQEQQQLLRDTYSFGIFTGASEKLAGIVIVKVGWKPGVIPPILSGELTFFLDAAYRGRGYSTRALTRVRDWCFEELQITLPGQMTAWLGEVCAVCLPGNAASKAVLEKLFGQGRMIISPEGINVPRFDQSRAEYEA